ATNNTSAPSPREQHHNLQVDSKDRTPADHCQTQHASRKLTIEIDEHTINVKSQSSPWPKSCIAIYMQLMIETNTASQPTYNKTAIVNDP
ncbi:hypothetical protein AAHH78_34275, partial [Burkholderia pseudomallei]